MRIEDYALIGDCHSAALVARDGSVDWLCLPRFDSPACLAALLGTARNGRWQLVPAEPATRVTRRYRPDTLMLETSFETATGSVTLIDFMPPRSDEPHLVRIVRGVSGEVAMRMQLVVRFDYGSIVPWVTSEDGVLKAIAGPDKVLLRTPCPTHGQDLTTVADFVVRAGEAMPFDLCWGPSYLTDPLPLDVTDAEAATQAWWQAWVGRCTHQGPWREAVVRSLITLKALTYAPTGGIVAAPTTSLPECIGSPRNWDYRFCWLRDATMTLYTLMSNGYTEEARDWRAWLVRAIAGTPSQLNIMYGIGGERRLTELELGWLDGYEGSRPVRIGNAAHQQFQLDVFGEVAAALHLGRVGGMQVDGYGWSVERELLRFLEGAWREPDEGIWEVRGPRRHFTHSKVMAWLAFDRMIASAEQFGLEGPVEQWKQQRALIHEDVCRNGFDAERGHFVQYYGAKGVDASLLFIPIVGFLPATDTRVLGTIDAIERQLMSGGLVRRYVTEQDIDGLPPGEGVFIACSLWLASALQAAGRHDDAKALFERVLALRNDVGLLSEEYDPATRRLLGNFPQALSHIGIIGTAMRLGPAPGRAPVTAQPTVTSPSKRK